MLKKQNQITIHVEINKAEAQKTKHALLQNIQNTKAKLKNNLGIIMKQLIEHAKNTYVAKPQMYKTKHNKRMPRTI